MPNLESVIENPPKSILSIISKIRVAAGDTQEIPKECGSFLYMRQYCLKLYKDRDINETIAEYWYCNLEENPINRRSKKHRKWVKPTPEQIAEVEERDKRIRENRSDW